MEIPSQITRRGIARVWSVEFSCPGCKAALHAPLTDAGKRDACPECSTGFITPGSAELNRQNAERINREKAEAQRRDAERARKAEAERRAARTQHEPLFKPRGGVQKDESRTAACPGRWVGLAGFIIAALGGVLMVGSLLVALTGEISVSFVALGTGFGAWALGCAYVALDFIRAELFLIRRTFKRVEGQLAKLSEAVRARAVNNTDAETVDIDDHWIDEST